MPVLGRPRAADRIAVKRPEMTISCPATPDGFCGDTRQISQGGQRGIFAPCPPSRTVKAMMGTLAGRMRVRRLCPPYPLQAYRIAGAVPEDVSSLPADVHPSAALTIAINSSP